MTPQEIINLQNHLVQLGYMTQAEMNTGPGIYGPRTTRAVDSWRKQQLSDILKEKEALNKTVEEKKKAAETEGIPFTQADRDAAYQEAFAAGEQEYQQQKQYETLNTQDLLKQKQLDYQNYLDTSATKFQEEKAKQDQEAASQGVLFSGGRAQKQQNLQRTYEQENAYKKDTAGLSMGGTARDYQYKYGNDAASSLSSYYNLGGNTYNPNVATGGVGSSGLSSVYSPSQGNFYGTKLKERTVKAQEYASGLLWNKGNKIVSGGYKNQY